MNKQITVYVEFEKENVSDSKLTEIVEAVSTYDEYGEPDTLISEWFLSPNKSTCTLIGRYADSRSFLYHMDRFLTGPHFKNINENIQNKISKKILNESNYYKDLIIKLDKISIIENFSNL